MGGLYVVTHTDLDGVAAAAAALRMYGYRPGEARITYTEPYELHEALREVAGEAAEGDLIVISDLGENEDNIGEVARLVSLLTSRGASVHWYDHHVWSRDSVGRLEAAGARLSIDTSTCATGVVVRHAPALSGDSRDPYLEELERVVCAADLWRWDHPLAPRLFRVTGNRRGASRWKNRLLEKLYNGVLWDEELESRLVEYVNLELEGYERALRTLHVEEARGLRVGVVVKGEGPPSNSLLAALVAARHGVDIAVVARPNGGVSLRSRRVDVQRIAARLGGGGHPRASGARVGLPLLVSLGSRLYPKLLSIYVGKVISRTLQD